VTTANFPQVTRNLRRSSSAFVTGELLFSITVLPPSVSICIIARIDTLPCRVKQNKSFWLASKGAGLTVVVLIEFAIRKFGHASRNDKDQIKIRP
jgi:hypothetical protein